MYRSTSGAVNALVEATPISGPVCIEMYPSAMRMACEPMAFTIDQSTAALAAPFLHRRQRVGGLPRLADRQHDRVPVDDRVAVAELRGNIHLHRDAGDVLDQDFADHAGVRGRAAGGDDDLLDALAPARASG